MKHDLKNVYRPFLFTVVAQAYKVDVEVIGGASRGCTAILRCVVPSFVKDLVRVVSWLQEPSFYIYPSLQGGNSIHSSFSSFLFFVSFSVSFNFVTARRRLFGTLFSPHFSSPLYQFL